jgi:DNA-binding transcriptional MerR regulator
MATGSKSASAFRTISEVATELNLPKHVLRFWETRFNQIHPLKRGGGRRYYRREDIDLLRQIRGLLYDNGYTIKGVQKLLRNGSAKNAPKVEAEKVTENADPVGYNAELQSILSELRDIQGLLRNWA